MAENTIDTLSIEIKSDAARAEQSIKNLADALVRLASDVRQSGGREPAVRGHSTGNNKRR